MVDGERLVHVLDHGGYVIGHGKDILPGAGQVQDPRQKFFAENVVHTMRDLSCILSAGEVGRLQRVQAVDCVLIVSQNGKG